MTVKLNSKEFEILKDDSAVIVLYDKVVDKLYTFDKAEKKWVFPAGARTDVIGMLTGVSL